MRYLAAASGPRSNIQMNACRRVIQAQAEHFNTDAKVRAAQLRADRLRYEGLVPWRSDVCAQRPELPCGASRGSNRAARPRPAALVALLKAHSRGTWPLMRTRFPSGMLQAHGLSMHARTSRTASVQQQDLARQPGLRPTTQHTTRPRQASTSPPSAELRHAAPLHLASALQPTQAERTSTQRRNTLPAMAPNVRIESMQSAPLLVPAQLGDQQRSKQAANEALTHKRTAGTPVCGDLHRTSAARHGDDAGYLSNVGGTVHTAPAAGVRGAWSAPAWPVEARSNGDAELASPPTAIVNTTALTEGAEHASATTRTHVSRAARSPPAQPKRAASPAALAAAGLKLHSASNTVHRSLPPLPVPEPESVKPDRFSAGDMLAAESQQESSTAAASTKCALRAPVLPRAAPPPCPQDPVDTVNVPERSYGWQSSAAGVQLGRAASAPELALRMEAAGDLADSQASSELVSSLDRYSPFLTSCVGRARRQRAAAASAAADARAAAALRAQLDDASSARSSRWRASTWLQLC